MNRRRMLRSAGVAATGLLAGCGGVLGSSCGPGDDSIEDLAADLESTATVTETPAGTESTESLDQIKGSIQSIAENAIVIDDGTGTAKLTTFGGGFRMQNVQEGDCASAGGVATTPEEGADHDVTFYVTVATVEE